MAREAMLAHVPIPAANVHAVPTTDTTPEAAADAYAATLKTFYGSETLDPSRPLFAVTMLGLGEDGHTASLFPGTAALDERVAWATSVVGAKPEPRITMTYPVLDSSAALLFLIAGDGKEKMLRALEAGDPSLPASHVQPVGEFYIFCDKAAARPLSGRPHLGAQLGLLAVRIGIGVAVLFPHRRLRHGVVRAVAAPVLQDAESEGHPKHHRADKEADLESHCSS
jgi:6-phosphogluconolactonase/glucosamine-6-phosphate isomerase/deaminase